MGAYDPWDGRADRNGSGGGLGLGLATLAFGAALGAVTALLFAPKSGKDLRSQVADTAGDWKSHAADALAQGRERVVSAVETGQTPPPPSHDPRAEERVGRASSIKDPLT